MSFPRALYAGLFIARWLARSYAIIITSLCVVLPLQIALSQTTLEEPTLIQAEEVQYDQNAETLTAKGRVEISRGERILLADEVTYNQITDVAIAKGNGSMVDKDGTVVFFDEARVTGDLKSAFAREVRLLLADKSRMASRSFLRLEGNVNELDRAVYSACDQDCKARDPVWQIKARRVIHYQDEKLLSYRDAWVEILGIPVLYTPYLAHPDPTTDRQTGFLAPTFGGGSNLGFSFSQPYYVNLEPHRDATFTPLLTTSAGSGAIAEYRQLLQKGELSLHGSLVAGDQEDDIRGHVLAKGRYNLDERWRLGADVHLASDDTYLRRYDFDAPTWLTTNVFLERFGTNSYFSAKTYNFQRQRRAVATGTTPIVSPLIKYSYVSDRGANGSYYTADANSLILLRQDGSDSSRLSGKLGWHLPYTSPAGDIYTLRATIRGDGYYIKDAFLINTGEEFTGFQGRAIPQLSMEWRYPLVRNEGRYHQFLEPIVMGVLSPIGQNPDQIPNEDSRDFEFDDTNLFREQRFTGFDRVEGGARINYGVRWGGYDRRGGSLSLLVGQSYRFNTDATFTDASGLRGKFSDFVGRLSLRPHRYMDLQYRFRLDKDSFRARRSEVTGIFGPPLFRLRLNYIFVKQSDPLTPDFGDREELYSFFSSRLSKYWSLSASHRENLEPGGGAIRTSLGIQYEDECFIFGLDIAEDKTEDRDFQSGFAILFRFTLKTIGEVRLTSDVGVTQ